MSSATTELDRPEPKERWGQGIMGFRQIHGKEWPRPVPTPFICPGLAALVSGPSEVAEMWLSVGASTVRVSNALMEIVECVYQIRDRASVLWFLECYPSLISLLVEAHPRIAYYFPFSQLFLELLSDPEDHAEHQLIVLISTLMEPEQALRQLDEFDEDWGLSLASDADGKICVNLEFR